MVNLLIKHFVDTLKHISEPLFSLIEVSNANPKTYLTNLIIRKDSLKLKKIEKFSKMMNIVLNLGSEETMEEESLNKKNVSEV